MLACPDCATSRIVRATAFGDQFWTNVAALALPLLVLAVLASLLNRIGAPRSAPRTGERRNDD